MNDREETRNRAHRGLGVLLGGLFLLGASLALPGRAAAAVCGDGILDISEVCDDGNLVNGDGCSQFCQDETLSCIDDVTGVTNNCTANDVDIALVLNETEVYCEQGSTVDLNLIADLVATSQERYDIGIFIAQDGGTARTGSCFKSYLPPPLAPALPSCHGTCSVSGASCLKSEDCAGFLTGEVCTGGYNPGSLTVDPNGQLLSFENGGPFYDGECSEDPVDACGDLEQQVINAYALGTVRVPCEDHNGDGRVDVGSCVSWDNQRSHGTPQAPSCNTIRDTVPNTRAKCNCETLNVANVFVAGSIVVDKVTDPAGDPTLFDFVVQRAGTTVDSFSLADATTPHQTSNLPPTTIPPHSTYSVAETVPAGWEQTEVECLGSTGDVEDPSAIDLGSGETVTCTFTNVKPSVTLTKTCDPLSKIGDSVDYQIVVDNTTGAGASDLVCTVTDPLLGLSQTVTLASGASTTIPASRQVVAGDGDPLNNTAGVSCVLQGGSTTVASASGSCSTNLFQPAISLTKTGDTLSKIGDPTSYTITLSNTSSPDTPNLTCTLTDAALGVSKTVTLAPGANDVTSVTVPIPAGASDPYVTTASASCSPAGFPNVLTASASHSVNLFQPSISFAKTGDALSKIGDPTDYTITLGNTSSSDTPNLTCTVTDHSATHSVTLAPGATDTWNFSQPIPAGASDPYVNTASVACSPAGFPNVLTGEASHSVNLFQPSISLAKTGDAVSKIGDPTDYTITLGNTSSSDTPSLTCTVTDHSATHTVTLASGATDTWNFTQPIPAGATDPYVNTASVSCSPAGFPNVLTASASHSVNLFQPSISFAKTGDALSKIGDPTDYTITLGNTSSSDTPSLTCTVTDHSATHQVNLAPGATDTWNFSQPIPAGASDPYVNTASVSCSPAGFPNVVTATASHSVNLFQPAITLAKTGDAYSKVGDPVDYTITLGNTSSSDTPSLVCTISDPAAGVSKTVTLASGASDVTQATAAVPVGASDPYVNTASVSCSPAGFPNVLATTSSWSVDLVHPSFTVTKSCVVEPVPQSGPAQFAVQFVNTGDVGLQITADDGIGSFALAAGQSASFPVSVAGPFAGQATVTNQVNATATLALPGLPNVVPGSASATCVVGGRVEVEKLTNGVPNDESTGMTWHFRLSGPGLPAGGVTASSPPPTVDFGLDNLMPSVPGSTSTYQFCEIGIPAGWTTQWLGDADFDGTPETIIPHVLAASSAVDPTLEYSNIYDPNYQPPPAVNDNSTRCVDFWVRPGATKAFQIDNQFPGGEPRTIGYWKNWNSCSGGGQVQTAQANGGPDAGWFLLDDVLEPPGLTVGLLTLVSDPGEPTCDAGIQNAVRILDKRDLLGNKRANDAAYGMAAQLVAALANLSVGAETCQAVLDATQQAQALLLGLRKYNPGPSTIGFDGYGAYLDPATVRKYKLQTKYNQAIQLGSTLDGYNNGALCGSFAPVGTTSGGSGLGATQ